MALISGEVPGLLGGVSQQPPVIRLRNQSGGQLNTFDDLRLGLGKRPPFEFVRNLNYSNAPLHPFVHFVDRDENEKYTFLVSDGVVKVYDLDGDPYTVNQTDDAIRYLRAARSNQDLKALTVADTTFIMNRRVTTAMSPARSQPSNFWALIWVKGGNYSMKYTIRVAGRTYSFTTVAAGKDFPSDGFDAGDGLQGWVATSYIAQQIANVLSGATVTAPDGGAGAGFMSSYYTVDESGPLPGTFTVLHKPGSSVIAIQHVSRQRFKCEANDDAGNSLIGVASDVVQRFADLPNLAMQGQTVRISGDKATNDDDYWVTFRADGDTSDGPSKGVWEEAVTPGALTSIDKTTMPYVIRRVYDSTTRTISFTVQAYDWADRQAGGDTSNKVPQVIGFKLTDLTLFRNRLGLFAGTKFSFTRPNDLANFWRATVLAIRDDDPIHGNATTPKVLRIDHAVPFNRELLLVSEKAQQVLGAPDALTTKTFSVQETAAYDADPFCRPLAADNMVFLPFYDGSYSQLREFRVVDQAGTKGAIGLTEAVPKYLAGRPLSMAVCGNINTLTVLTENERDVLHVYRWANDGNARALSAWFKWDVGGIVLGQQWIGSTLWLVVSRGTTFPRRTTDAYRKVTDLASAGSDQALPDSTASSSGGDAVLLPSTYGVTVDTAASVPTTGGDPTGSDPGSGSNPNGDGVIPGNPWTYGYSGPPEDVCGGEVCLIKAEFASGRTDDGLPFVQGLDFRIADTLCTVTYDPTTNLTTFAVPFNVPSSPAVVTRYDPDDLTWVPGKAYTGTKVVGQDKQFTLTGDWRSKALWIGDRFTFWYKFSPQIPRRQTPSGALVPVTTAHLQLLRFKVHCSDTGYFELKVTPSFRDTATYAYEGRRLDQSPPTLDAASFVTDELAVGVGADSNQVTIELVNDTHMPCWFAAAEWEGQIRYKSQRV